MLPYNHAKQARFRQRFERRNIARPLAPSVFGHDLGAMVDICNRYETTRDRPAAFAAAFEAKQFVKPQ
jgi:hypothetical protein